MSEEEKKAIEQIKVMAKSVEIVKVCDMFLTDKEKELIYDKKNNFKTINEPVQTILNLIEKQQKEIEALEIIHNTYKEMIEENNYISKDKIREKIKELEKQKEKLKYDGNVCFADYEQFCKNLKFLKDQTKELLEEK